jgi:hypothetical protein
MARNERGEEVVELVLTGTATDSQGRVVTAEVKVDVTVGEPAEGTASLAGSSP